MLGAPAGSWYTGASFWILKMAKYHFKASFCSRSSGKGAVAQAAYRNGGKFKDDLRGRTFDYSQKHDEHRIHNEILAPEHAPDWMKDSSSLWNGVQKFETNLIHQRYSAHHKDPIKREKSLLGREKALSSAQDAASFIVALPRELTKDQNIEFLRSYLTDRFVSRGLVVDYSIHGASGNWHAHFAVTLRPVLETGDLSPKKITSYRGEQNHLDIFNKDGLIESRKAFADYMNHSFERYGIPDRVSHKSFADQGIMREATVHEGPYARILKDKGEHARLCSENAAIRERNINLYLENPHYFLNDIARTCVQFDGSKVAKEIHNLVEGDEDRFHDLYSKVSAIEVPLEAKSPHKGSFVYDSEAIINHLTPIIAAEKANQIQVSEHQSVAFVKGIAQSYLQSEFSEDEYQRVGLANVLIKQAQKEHGFDNQSDAADSVLKDIVESPSLLVNALAKEKIVFKERDVESTLMGLIGSRESSYRILEAYGGNVPLMAAAKSPLNQTIDLSDSFVQKELDHWITSLIKDVIHSDSSLNLHSDASRQEVFTSKDQHLLEKQTLDRVSRLAANKDKFVLKDKYISKVIDRYEAYEDKRLKQKSLQATFAYSDEQKEGIRTLLSPGQIKILKGRAGTGKSTVLKPVVKALVDKGYDVKGMSFTGKVAEFMQEELEVSSKNIEQYKHAWKKHQKAVDTLSNIAIHSKQTIGQQKETLQRYQGDCITSNTVLIIDEGSMVSHSDYEIILAKVEEAGAKLLIVKDDAQIKAIHGADISEAMDSFVDHSDLTDVRRQRISWMREASKALNAHKVEAGLKLYEEHGHITYCETEDQTRQNLIDDYINGYQADKQQFAIAFRNADVTHFNRGILKGLQSRGLVEKETFALQEGQPLAVGAKVMFTKNDNTGWAVHNLEAGTSKMVGVRNGTFGVIEYFNPETSETHVRLSSDNRLVAFNRPQDRKQGKVYDGLTLAYAITNTKSQAQSFDDDYVYISPYDDANSSLVSLTRHKDSAQIYVSKEHASNHRDLATFIGGSHHIGTSLDYSVSDEEKPYLEKVSSYRDTNIEIGKAYGQKKAFSESYHREFGDRETWDQDVWHQYKVTSNEFAKEISHLESSRKAIAQDILSHWRQCALFAKQVSISEETLSKHAGYSQGRFTSHELKRFETVERYFDVCVEISSLRGRMGKELTRNLIETHELYGLYEELIDHRTRVACDIVRSPEAFQPLMRVKAIYGEGEDPIAYETLHGKSYDRPLPSFEKCLDHATFRDPAPLVFEISETGKQQSELFEALTAYQKADVRYRQSYYELQTAGDVFLMPGMQERFEEQRTTDELSRDEHAFHVDTLLQDLSYGATVPILAHLGLDEQDLSKIEASALSHKRLRVIEAYEKADTLDQRFALAEGIHKELYQGDICHKQAYAQYVSRGLDPQRLQFDMACKVLWDSKAASAYQTLDDLNAAYTDIQAYKDAHQASKESWTVIRSSIESRVKSIQLDQIQTLNEIRGDKALSYETLREDAFEAMKFNVGNADEPEWRVNEQKVLSYVSGELRRELSSFGSIRDAGIRSELLSQDRQLRMMNHVLDGGRKALSSHYDLMNEDGTPYLNQVKAKETIADRILDRHGPIIEVAFGEGFNRLVQSDALQARSRSLVKNNALDLDKTKNEEDALAHSKEANSKLDAGSAPHTKKVRSFSELSDFDMSAFRKRVNESIDAERLAHNLLHGRGFNASQSNSQRLHFGRKGSLCVNVEGHRRNSFKNFETGEGGDLIALVQDEKRCDFKEALDTLAPYSHGHARSELDAYLGGKSINRDSVHDRSLEDKRREKDALMAKKAAEEKAQKVADIKELLEKSVPIEGSPAELYLRNERNIQGELPDSLRYIPPRTEFTYNGELKDTKTGAMVSIAKTAEGDTKAIQLTYITTDGERMTYHNGDKFTKTTYGSVTGAYVTLQEGSKNSPFIMAEGVETALSVKEAGVQGKVVCSLGITNYKNVIEDQKNVIIAADWDGSKDKPTYIAAEKAKTQIEDNGGKAQIILPVESPEQNSVKADFNDVLQEKGLASVKELLNNQADNLLKDTNKTPTPEKNNEPAFARDQEETASHQHRLTTENAPQMGKGQSVETDSEQDYENLTAAQKLLLMSKESHEKREKDQSKANARSQQKDSQGNSKPNVDTQELTLAQKLIQKSKERVEQNKAEKPKSKSIDRGRGIEF